MVFLFIICGSISNHISGLNILDALLIVFLVLGFVNGVSANKSCKEKKYKDKPTASSRSKPYESHSVALNCRSAPSLPPLAAAAVCNESPTQLLNEPDTDNKTTVSQSTQDSRSPLSDEKIICEVSVYQTFLRGVEYAQSQRVKNIQFDKERGFFKANTVGSQIYNTGIQITEQGDIVGYFCTCEAYKNYPRACKHIIALAKCAQQNWAQHYPAPTTLQLCQPAPCQKNQIQHYPNPVTQSTRKQEKTEEISQEEHKVENIPTISVGKIVTHRFFGTGIVAKIDNCRITIKFPTESKTFLYPDVIQQGFLRAENGKEFSYR